MTSHSIHRTISRASGSCTRLTAGGTAGAAGGRHEVLPRLLRSVPQLCLPADQGTGTGRIRVACAAADDHGSAVGEAADDTAALSRRGRHAAGRRPRWEGRPAIRAGTTTSSPTPRSRYRHAPAGAGCEPSPWSGRTGIAGSSGSRPQRTDTRRTSPALIEKYRSWRCGRSRPSYSSLRRPWNSRPTQPTAPLIFSVD